MFHQADLGSPPTPRRHARRVFPLAGLVATLVVLPLAAGGAAATGLLENPSPGSVQSGVGVLSGWHCDASTTPIEIVIDGTHIIPAAAGTPREDTSATCGDTANGFGALWNFALLGPGAHTAVARAGGVTFSSRDFMVTTLGVPFARGLEGTFQLDDFPNAQGSVLLTWQEAQQGFAIANYTTWAAPTSAARPAPVSSGLGSAAATDEGLLENPGTGSVQSGVILFSGWHCNATTLPIDIVVDGTTVIPAAAGTPRDDTAARCGDSNNGFGVLWNANLFGPGTHTAVARADGVPFDTNTFQVTTLGANFLRGVAGRFRLPGFPGPSEDVWVVWSEAKQNFVIDERSPTEGPTPQPASTPTPGASTPTPGAATPTPSGTSTPAPTPTAAPTAQPTATPVPTPAPTPTAGPLCGNGVVDFENGEECDGSDLDGEDCDFLYGGSASCSGQLACTPDCRFDGSQCDCPCDTDIDCDRPLDHPIECGPTYCGELSEPVCSISNPAPGCCDCVYDWGVCLNGRCVADDSFSSATLNQICFGYEDGDPDFPRCDWTPP